ncbi:MAG TPA: hypothetical protein ENN40_01745 [Candidatus Aminicenantes bacterium]|nr:hypothetical protein [Candidatus Aminicenantes bacterium]
MTFKSVLSICVILFFSLILLAQVGDISQKDEDDYRVGPQDLLEIKVFEVPELNITTRVAENGTIALPLLGVVDVEGLTRRGVEEKLAKLLEESYLKNAQVTVFIKEYESRMVSVMGAVKSPGNYKLLGSMTLMQLLSRAGGLTGDMGEKIIVIRTFPGGKTASLSIDLDGLMLRGDPKLNIPLMDNDIVNVPIERTYDVFVFGQVEKPGNIQMSRGTGMTLMKAIAQAGGFTQRARRGSVSVTRTVDGEEKKITVNVKKILRGKQKDFQLEPNDVVFVPESLL